MLWWGCRYCPALTGPNWDARPTFCYPDAATHLSYGLREVYENVFFPATNRPTNARVPKVLVTISDGLANSCVPLPSPGCGL